MEEKNNQNKNVESLFAGEKKEVLDETMISKVAGGGSGALPHFTGHLPCSCCNKDCIFTYIPDEASGSQNLVTAYCTECLTPKVIALGAGI